MAYKDEYEVARLYTDGDFQRKIKAQFAGDYKLRLHLAPPLLSRRDPHTGHLIKREFPGWMLNVFGLLAKLRFPARFRSRHLRPFRRTSAGTAGHRRLPRSCSKNCWRT